MVSRNQKQTHSPLDELVKQKYLEAKKKKKIHAVFFIIKHILIHRYIRQVIRLHFNQF